MLCYILVRMVLLKMFLESFLEVLLKAFRDFSLDNTIYENSLHPGYFEINVTENDTNSLE